MAIHHYENFPVASLLLPRRLRRAVTDIYRFARCADDIADEGTYSDAERLQSLAIYREQLHHIALCQKNAFSITIPPSTVVSTSIFEPIQAFTVGAELAAVFTPLALTIAQHQLPLTPFYQLLLAFEQDIRVTRYPDMTSLLDYCTRSANPIGHLMLHLYQATNAENLRDADAICTGLQCANFWQDVHLDWLKGRVYLPQEALEEHGVTEEDIAAGRLGPRWEALMRHQIAQTRALLVSGKPLAHRLPGRIGLELRLIVQGGLRILERIEQTHYDVFMHRPKLKAKDWRVIFWRALR